MIDKGQPNSLFFKIAVGNVDDVFFSTNIDQSDFSNNQIFLNSVVGTLVKYGTSGRLEPYLASEWTTSPDKKKWTFKIREELVAEDGSKINAALIKATIEGNLKRLSKNGSVVDFDNLVGFDDFINEKYENIPGIETKENQIHFIFSKSPSDLLELLRMPYFGAWLEDNKKMLISTASYSIESFSRLRVSLKLRENWFKVNTNSIKSVQIIYQNLNDSLINKGESAIVKIPYNFEVASLKDCYQIKGLPTRLEAFVLSPYKENYFNFIKNRYDFQHKIKRNPLGLIKSDYFYTSAKSDVKYGPNEDIKTSTEVKKLTFAIERSSYTEADVTILTKSISNALSGIPFELIFRNNDKDFFIKTDTNRYFDARVTTVDIGGYPDYSILHMMFCTKLGVSFPDNGNRICELINANHEMSNSVTSDFIAKFNQILADEAVVIPINHFSEKWLVSNDIDSASLPPTGMYPQFETLVRN